MKIRNGFVSNSSSSSFVCDICSDAFEIETSSSTFPYENHNGVAKFACGHEICADCARRPEENFNKISEHAEAHQEEVSNGASDELPVALCPICSFLHISKGDLLYFMIKKLGFNADIQVIEYIKKQYPDYKTFKSSMEGQYKNAVRTS